MMKAFPRGLALLWFVCSIGFPSLTTAHGDEEHGNHDSAHGGLVMMYIDLHFEIVLLEEGGVQIHYSDAGRSPLPAAVVSDVMVEILDAAAPGETIPMSVSAAGDFWEGDGSVVSSPVTIVRVSFLFQGEPLVFELPARLFPAFMEPMPAMPAHHA